MNIEQQHPGATLTSSHASADKARRVADVSVITWRRHDAALSPIIGKLGFAAVYRRCVAQQGRAEPWLETAHRGVAGTGDFDALHHALGACTGRQASLTQGTLMQSFHGLLTALIGKPLLTEALRSARRSAPRAASTPTNASP